VGDIEVRLSGWTESPMKHHSFKISILTQPSMLYDKVSDKIYLLLDLVILNRNHIEPRGLGTVSGGQFKWGTCPLKSSEGVQRSA